MPTKYKIKLQTWCTTSKDQANRSRWCQPIDPNKYFWSPNFAFFNLEDAPGTISGAFRFFSVHSKGIRIRTQGHKVTRKLSYPIHLPQTKQKKQQILVVDQICHFFLLGDLSREQSLTSISPNLVFLIASTVSLCLRWEAEKERERDRESEIIKKRVTQR